jgi:acylphosphatase
MTESNIETHRVIFHGRVQGVGFRWNTNRIAKRFAVKGYVKNLTDGTVELVAYGTSTAVWDLIRAIQESFDDHITDRVDDRVESDEQFDRFEIRR